MPILTKKKSIGGHLIHGISFSLQDLMSLPSNRHDRPNGMVSLKNIGLVDFDKDMLSRLANRVGFHLFFYKDVDNFSGLPGISYNINNEFYKILINTLIATYFWDNIALLLKARMIYQYLSSKRDHNIRFMVLSRQNIRYDKFFADMDPFMINVYFKFANSIYKNELKYAGFYNFCHKHGYEFGPYSHPLEEAHQKYAEYLYNKIIKDKLFD